VRATRAYLAGFGTAGSLLAGAALLFILASAVVSFRGWPQMTTQAAPVAVVRLPAPAPATVKHVDVIARAGARSVHAAVLRSAIVPSRPSARASSHPQRATVSHISPPHVRLPGSRIRLPSSPPRLKHPVTTAPATTPACTGGCSTVRSLTGALSSVATEATGSLGKTVTTAGHSIGSLLSGVTSAAGSRLATASPPLGHAVQDAGTSLSNTVTTATTALGDTVAGAGKALGAVLAR
jgi:hypothetical protein